MDFIRKFLVRMHFHFSSTLKECYLLIIRCPLSEINLLSQAEAEMRVAQAEFDKQVEITKLLMDGLAAIQTNHLRHLNNFVEAQSKYYANCHQIMQDLQRELSRYAYYYSSHSY